MRSDAPPSRLARSLADPAPRADFFLLTVSPRLEVVLFEGQPPSTIALDGPETLIGGNFAELWPSPELQQAVQRVLDGEIERDYVQISEHTSDGQISHHRFRVSSFSMGTPR